MFPAIPHPQKISRHRLIGMIGNLLEHYDNALFGLLAPFLSPLFFQNSSPITALILTYSLLPLGIITKPLGAWFFGWLADRVGGNLCLSYSLLATALVSLGMGCLPLYHQIGVLAPCLLALGKMLQGFLSAGETVTGAIFVLERTPHKKRSLMSSLYDASTVLGILLASSLVSLMSFSPTGLETGWRWLYFFGGFTAIFGGYLRFQNKKPSAIPVKQSPSIKDKKAFIPIILASGFSALTYAFAFTLMNGFIPLVTSLTKQEAVQLNTLLLVVDVLLLPCLGFVAQKFGKRRTMKIATLLTLVSAIPLFLLMENASFLLVACIRLVIVTLGIAFAAPYHAWALEQVPQENRYTLLSLGYAIGSQLIGAPAAAVSLWMYQKTEWIFSPAIYLMISAGLTYWVLVKKTSRKNSPKT